MEIHITITAPFTVKSNTTVAELKQLLSTIIELPKDYVVDVNANYNVLGHEKETVIHEHNHVLREGKETIILEHDHVVIRLPKTKAVS